MKALGFVRNIDMLGRVVIPKETRTKHGWEPTDPIEMFETEDGIVLRKYVPGCDICGEIYDGKYTYLHKKAICPSCVQALASVDV